MSAKWMLFVRVVFRLFCLTIEILVFSVSGSEGGLVLRWDQPSQCMIVGGDSRVIRVWEAEREQRLCDLPSATDSAVTCLDCGANSGRRSVSMLLIETMFIHWQTRAIHLLNLFYTSREFTSFKLKAYVAVIFFFYNLFRLLFQWLF